MFTYNRRGSNKFLASKRLLHGYFSGFRNLSPWTGVNGKFAILNNWHTSTFSILNSDVGFKNSSLNNSACKINHCQLSQIENHRNNYF